MLHCTRTPCWISGMLRPGQDVVWLQAPFSSLAGAQTKPDTKLPYCNNCGFVLNTQHIVAHKTFADATPRCRQAV